MTIPVGDSQHNTYSFESYSEALATIGWSPLNQNETDTIQQMKSDTKGNTGILLCASGTPSLFLRVTDKPISDPLEIYETLLFGWNLDAPLTAVPSPRELLRIYNTTYRPSKEAIFRGEEIPVAELSLADMLDIKAAQHATGKLLLLSPDTWRSQDYEQFLSSPTGQRRLTVDNALIKDLQDWRLALVRNLYEQHPSTSLDELDSTAQKILDELIFIRFCEDRKLTKLELLFDIAASTEGDKLLNRFQSLVSNYAALFDTSLFDTTLTERVRPAPFILQTIIAQSVEFYKFDLLDVDLLGRIYEEYLSYRLKQSQQGLFYEIQLEQRKQQGIYYTPSYIVEYIVGRAFHIFQETNGRLISFALDLACGSGIFLTTLLKELLRLHSSDTFSQKCELLQKTIYGIDNDERAVRRAAQSLYYTLLTGESHLVGRHLLPELMGHNLLVKDSTLDRRYLVPGVSPDIIISNPPYRRISGEQLDQYRDLYTDVIFNHSDLCWLMLVAAIDNLTDGGVVAFIVPDNVLRTKEYFKLRKYILDTTRIVEISYLDYQAFESTSLQNIILILQRTSLEKLRHENLILVNYYSTPGVFERKAFDEIPQSGFYNQELDYVFNVQLTAPIKAVYEKIKTQSKLTIDYLEVSQGIKPNRQALHNVPIHSDCKKYLLGKDIQPYVVNWSGTYIDYNLEEVSQLPNVRLRTPDLFENSVKIIVRKIVSERLVVALDFEKYYVDSASYILLPKVNVPEDFVYLALAILTSPIIKFCYRIEYPERKLAFPQIRGIDIERLPFPDTELSENVSIIKSVVVEVKKLYTDVKIGKVKGSAIYKTSEARQIDNLLAQLYNLNELELSLIDAYLEQQ